MNFQFELVPPPARAPVDEIAETLGLHPGLRVERGIYGGGWRCCHCDIMQKPDAWLVWVPDSVRMGDPGWSVIDAGRRNAYNGSGGGWCLRCAQKLCGSPIGAPAMRKKWGWFARFFQS